MQDIFKTQLDIAQNVADQLHLILSPEKIEQIEKLQPKNPEAYNNYLLGQYFCLKRDSLSIQKGIGYFKKAIEIDSNYTLAYSGLANGFYALAFTGNIEIYTGYATAYKMAEQALKMDSTLAEAYAVLGVVNYFGYWNWEKARILLEKALEVDSNCMVAHLYHCSFLDIVGEPEKALYHANKAIELEPYFHMPYHMKGLICRNNDKYAESTAAIMRSHELNPEYWDKHLILSNYLYLNDEMSAVKFLSELFSVETGFQKYENSIYPAYEASGINGVLTLYREAMLEQEVFNPIFLTPILNIRLGMNDKALTLLEIACRERRADIPRMIRYPEFENLHSNPRFQAMVDTMNLRPYFPKPGKPVSSR
jgi:tetratricopeptide (TPR) repeat protein